MSILGFGSTSLTTTFDTSDWVARNCSLLPGAENNLPALPSGDPAPGRVNFHCDEDPWDYYPVGLNMSTFTLTGLVFNFVVNPDNPLPGQEWPTKYEVVVNFQLSSGGWRTPFLAERPVIEVTPTKADFSPLGPSILMGGAITLPVVNPTSVSFFAAFDPSYWANLAGCIVSIGGRAHYELYS